MTDWFMESLHPEIGQRFRMDKVIYRDKTEHQDLVIFENAVLGRVLALDGVVQTTEADEHVYHEMMAHVPILAHGAVRRVLIIGGGDGGMLRRCLMHPAVEKVTMVEIDRGVVDLCTTHLPSISAGAFDDPRTDLVIDDGRAFVARTDDRYDVIIVDSTDPIGPGEVLFTAEFYADCKRCLTPGGILVTQSGVPFLQRRELTDIHGRLRPLFADVSFFVAAVPTYYGGYMTMGWATDAADLRRQDVAVIRRRFEAGAFDTRFYTPEMHVASFALPRFVAEAIGTVG